MDAVNLGERYDLPLLEWPSIANRLERGMTQAPGTGGPEWMALARRSPLTTAHRRQGLRPGSCTV